jgi:lipopolysaccharide/colanic/teichoic acid biosynthesis glycosyltransferase
MGPDTSRFSVRLQLFVKRLMDIVVSLVALIVLSPLLLVIVILIKTTSKGPIVYRWKVVGKDCKRFCSWKFRTMVQNADALKDQLLTANEMMGPVFKIRNDPRVTPVGRVLRKYSLDELPQLVSVLIGDMSLVGPRPCLQSEFDSFTEWHKQKFAVKSGITCLWQISGRNDINDFDLWVKMDLDYIEHWSLWLDIKILLKTLPAVLSARGAS